MHTSASSKHATYAVRRKVVGSGKLHEMDENEAGVDRVEHWYHGGVTVQGQPQLAESIMEHATTTSMRARHQSSDDHHPLSARTTTVFGHRHALSGASPTLCDACADPWIRVCMRACVHGWVGE